MTTYYPIMAAKLYSGATPKYKVSLLNDIAKKNYDRIHFAFQRKGVEVEDDFMQNGKTFEDCIRAILEEALKEAM